MLNFLRQSPREALLVSGIRLQKSYLLFNAALPRTPVVPRRPTLSGGLSSDKGKSFMRNTKRPSLFRVQQLAKSGTLSQFMRDHSGGPLYAPVSRRLGPMRDQATSALSGKKPKPSR